MTDLTTGSMTATNLRDTAASFAGNALALLAWGVATIALGLIFGRRTVDTRRVGSVTR